MSITVVIAANVVVVAAVELSWFVWFVGEQHSSGVGKTIAMHRVCLLFVCLLFVFVCLFVLFVVCVVCCLCLCCCLFLFVCLILFVLLFV